MANKELLRMSRELDQMAESVTPDEAELLDVVLKKLKANKAVPPDEAEAVKKMHDKYLAPRETEELGVGTEEEAFESEEELE